MIFETAQEIYAQLDTLSKRDEILRKLWDGLMRSATRYARLRADWQLATLEQRVAMDEQRKRTHDAFIDDCNILSRAMAKQGLPVDWRAAIGQDRKEIGDFACHIHCLLGLMAR
jgi:hypothetical protein